MYKTRSRFLKQTMTRLCILNKKLYWKECRIFFLNCVEKHEAKKLIDEFHVGECGGNLYWKTTVKKNYEGRILLAYDII